MSVTLDCNLVRRSTKTYLLDHRSGCLLEIEPAVAAVLEDMGFVIDEANVIEATQRHPPASLRQTLELIQGLLKRGFLAGTAQIDTAFRCLRLHVTDRCNLKCSYCFETVGERDMSNYVGRKAVDFLLRTSDAKEVKVIFFGGEPLLAMDRIRQIFTYGRKQASEDRRQIRFAFSTNALLLSEALLSEIRDWDAGLLISYDGASHSRYRRQPSGGADEDEVTLAIHRATKLFPPERLAVAATIHHRNHDVPQVLRSIIALGVRSIKLTLEHTCQPPLALTAEDYCELESQTEEILDLCHQHPEIRVQGYSIDVEKDGRLRYARHCTACTSELTVNSSGSLYPCSFFVGDRRFRLGDVEEGVANEHIVSRFRAALDRATNPSCRRCSARYLCGGHCPYESSVLQGDLELPNELFCALSRSVSAKRAADYAAE